MKEAVHERAIESALETRSAPRTRGPRSVSSVDSLLAWAQHRAAEIVAALPSDHHWRLWLETGAQHEPRPSHEQAVRELVTTAAFENARVHRDGDAVSTTVQASPVADLETAEHATHVAAAPSAYTPDAGSSVPTATEARSEHEAPPAPTNAQQVDTGSYFKLAYDESAAQDTGPKTEQHGSDTFFLHYESWSDFMGLDADDLGHGGLFIAWLSPPELQASVRVRIRLPDPDLLDLVLDGTVVHVVSHETSRRTGMPAGFGVQFSKMSADRKRWLDIVLEYGRTRMFLPEDTGEIELPPAPSASSSALRLTFRASELRLIDELQAALVRSKSVRDHELLGLEPSASPEEIRVALAVHLQPWQAQAFDPRNPIEVQSLARQMVDRLEIAAINLRHKGTALRTDDSVSARLDKGNRPDGPQPRAVQLSPGAGTTGEVGAPPQTFNEREVPTARPVVEKRANAAAAPAPERPKLRHRIAQMLRRNEHEEPARQAHHPEPVRASATSTGSSHAAHDSDPLDEAAQLIGQRQYSDALAILEPLSKKHPSDMRTQLLVRFAQARQLVLEKQHHAALAKYEEVLLIDPHHRVAQRDITMLRCLIDGSAPSR